MSVTSAGSAQGEVDESDPGEIDESAQGDVGESAHVRLLAPNDLNSQMLSERCRVASRGCITKCTTTPRRGRRSPSTITSILPSLKHGEVSEKF